MRVRVSLVLSTVCADAISYSWEAVIDWRVQHGCSSQRYQPCSLPWQAWSADMLESARGAGTRMLLRAQHYFFFPILLFARLSWCQQGVAHAIDMTKVNPRL